MDNHALHGRPVLGLAALFTILSTTPLEAATLAHFDFEDAGGAFSNLAELVAPELTISAWSDADLTLGSVAGNPSSGWAVTAKDFDDGNEYRLSLSPVSGFNLALTGFSFDHRVSSSGPRTWELQLNGIPLAFGTTSTSFKSENIALSTVADTAPFLLSLYGTGASNSAGTYRLDNVMVSGTLSAVPLPASLWLFGSAIFGLVKAARTRTETTAMQARDPA
ncbi:MAG: hypothetical protein EXR86_12565 [Gammaproteobacteria bacterium]|nr:hypothetical protein [Gammaproteobacteria bacterium]